MSASAAVPLKQNVPSELVAVANTLSDDAQNAALAKCKELNYDVNKGRLSLEETLINLTHARDVLLDAVEKRKLIQLPLKLQYVLLEQTQRASKFLASMVNGADEILNLESAVEDLTSSIWQFNLHNLSGEVLGYHNKVNQLKAQEVAIREASREAKSFKDFSAKAQTLLEEITSVAKEAREERNELSNVLVELKEVVTKATENEQRVAAISVQLQQVQSAAAEQLAKSNISAAETVAIANKTKELQPEIEAARSELGTLIHSTQELITTIKTNIEVATQSFTERCEHLLIETKVHSEDLQKNTNALVTEISSDLKTRAEQALADIKQTRGELESKIVQEISAASSRLLESEAAHKSAFNVSLKDTQEKADKLIQDCRQELQNAVKTFLSEGTTVITEQNSKLNELANELGKLEGQIRDSIERATGYTLFHSFQKRQEAIAKSKRFWGVALGIAVAVSLTVSGIFIWSLRYVQAYNAAFYLKLSISLPLIYAIAFCSVQYSRERRLEEEYAFKSNISISLDPYQKLVAELVDKTKPEELAKYTAFVIESVNKVFTSPTETIFEDKKPDTSAPEKIIKSLGEFAEPIIKALKK
jgi:chromosome segregation ATPase